VGLDQWLWKDRLQGGLTYFENHFTDLIQWTQTSWTTGSFFNIAAARTKGFELYLQAKRWKGFTARTAYTYLTELKVLDDGGLVNINIITGRNLLRRPRQSGNFDLN
jgi:outer membrane cobalamin receptor